MTKKLVILRGNSGSGKSSVARELQLSMGYGTALIEQDYIRRKLLREKEQPDKPNIELIKLNAIFALTHDYNVIVEGILREDYYGDMLRDLIKANGGQAYVYYFDIPFEETLNRHVTKPNADEFGETEMRELYRPRDYLGVRNEQIISGESTFAMSIERILHDVNP